VIADEFDLRDLTFGSTTSNSPNAVLSVRDRLELILRRCSPRPRNLVMLLIVLDRIGSESPRMHLHRRDDLVVVRSIAFIP